MAPSQPQPELTDNETTADDSAAAFTGTLEDGTTVIGVNAILHGDLTVEGDLIVYGSLGGAVHGDVRHVSVEPNGRLTATVHSKSLQVSGELGGEAESDSAVRINRSARVFGKLSAPKFIVEDFRSLDHASLSGKIVPDDSGGE